MDTVDLYNLWCIVEAIALLDSSKKNKELDAKVREAIERELTLFKYHQDEALAAWEKRKK